MADSNFVSVSAKDVSELRVPRDEVIRLLIQASSDLGLTGAAAALSEESGVSLVEPYVDAFQESVLAGEWDTALTAVDELAVRPGTTHQQAKFLICEEKFLELLEGKKTKEALACLRGEVTPHSTEPTRLHRLTSLIMCGDPGVLREKAGWLGVDGGSRKELLVKLQAILSPTQMLPERRLFELLAQACAHQERACLYHNPSSNTFSLLEDHACSESQVPQLTIKLLEGHSDEVWHVAFSHDGTRLASASRDATVIIWDVTDPANATIATTLSGTNEPLSFVSWSPNDELMLTAGNDNFVRLWDPETGRCIRTFANHDAPVSAVAWFPDSERFVSGSVDKKVLEWDVEGRVKRQWECHRVADLLLHPEGTKMVVVSQKHIRVYDLEAKDPDSFVEYSESEPMSSATLSSDGRYLLTNIQTAALHLWDLERGHVIHKYRGQKQNRFVIRTCLGGLNEAFVVSGSEDASVYVWHRRHESLLSVLSGHTGTVNAVAWSPTNPKLFASASDDHTIRLWGVEDDASAGPATNGVNGVNGKAGAVQNGVSSESSSGGGGGGGDGGDADGDVDMTAADEDEPAAPAGEGE